MHLIQVQLIPIQKSGEARWQATVSDWTDEVGNFSFVRIEEGEYIIGIQTGEAPTGDLPFEGAFYPGVETEQAAERFYINESMHLELQAVALSRIPTATLSFRILFDDETIPPSSSLLIHNPAFEQGVIGNASVPATEGRGEVQLPVGFEYWIRASVWCDAGDRIDMRESRPIQKIRVSEGEVLKEMTFLAGQPCRLWTPPKSVNP